MEPISTALLATALVKVAEKLAEKAIVDPALKAGLEQFQKQLMGGYERAKAEEELRQVQQHALDDFLAQEHDKFERVQMVNALTDLSPETHQLLAACAVEMTKPLPRTIPLGLLQALTLEDDDREWLSVYLSHLRRLLAKNETYKPLIEYADGLAQRGLLEGLTREMEQVLATTQKLVSYVRVMADARHLTDDDAKTLDQYLALGRNEWGGLMLPMIRQRADDGRSYRLKQIFVPLFLQDKRAEEQARQKMERLQRNPERMAREEDDRARPVGFIELLQRYPASILIGKPGSGKTTLLRRAALAFAEGTAAEELGWQGKSLFPIFVRLRNFSEFLKGDAGKKFCDPGPGALLEYLKNRYQNGEYMSLTPDFFSRRLTEGDCLVLLDGLDEVAEGRDVVAQHINAFIKNFKTGNYFAISSRPGGYGRDEETALRASQLARAEVSPLDPNGIRQLIENLLVVMEWANETERRAAMQDLPASILASSDLTGLASIPLFCSALVQVYKYNKAKLPERRVDVLDEIVTLLLGHWHASKDDVTAAKELGLEDGTRKVYKSVEESVEYKYRRLRYLAYYMHTEARQYEIDAPTAQAVLARYFTEKERVKDADAAQDYAEGFLLNSHERSGLLAEITAATENKPATYAFIHQNFAEFLAATELVNRGHLVEAVLEHIEDPWWEQVILFAGARRGEFDHLRAEIVSGLMDAAEGRKKGWERRLTMAGHLARDMAGHLDGAVREELEQHLYDLATDAQLSAQTRAALADVRDELCAPDDIYMFVPAAQDAIYFAKYPVTNAQYARFLESDDFFAEKYWLDFPKYAEPEKGYLKLGHWAKAGYEWLQQNWDARKKVYPRYWTDARFGVMRPNAPVVGISWYEANAYCKWLLANWDELDEGQQGLAKPAVIRLPTESEWVLAAGGDENKRFAFGELKDLKDLPRYANTAESGINRTTPVWMYPKGISPAGVMDMSGNVFEWQANYSSNSQKYLTWRGGSWSNLQVNARVSNRSNVSFIPNYRNHYLGFRVCALPS